MTGHYIYLTILHLPRIRHLSNLPRRKTRIHFRPYLNRRMLRRRLRRTRLRYLRRRRLIRRLLRRRRLRLHFSRPRRPCGFLLTIFQPLGVRILRRPLVNLNRL